MESMITIPATVSIVSMQVIRSVRTASSCRKRMGRSTVPGRMIARVVMSVGLFTNREVIIPAEAFVAAWGKR